MKIDWQIVKHCLVILTITDYNCFTVFSPLESWMLGLFKANDHFKLAASEPTGMLTTPTTTKTWDYHFPGGKCWKHRGANIYPARFTWSLRIHHLSKENHLNQTTIFRFYINLWGCNMTSTRFRFWYNLFRKITPYRTPNVISSIHLWWGSVAEFKPPGPLVKHQYLDPAEKYYLRLACVRKCIGDKSATLIQGWTKTLKI